MKSRVKQKPELPGAPQTFRTRTRARQIPGRWPESARTPDHETISVVACRCRHTLHEYQKADAAHQPPSAPRRLRSPGPFLRGGQLLTRRAADSRGGFRFVE